MGVSSNADNQYKTYAELSSIAGFNVEEEVKSALGISSVENLDEPICDHCGCVIENEYDINETPDGETWCSDCFNDYYAVCDGCEETIDRDYAYWAFDGVYCETCFDERYVWCCRCGEPVDIDNYIDTPDGYMCYDCFRDSDWVECENCNEIIRWEDSQDTDDGYYCNDCFSEYYFRCDGCFEVFDLDDVVYDAHHNTWCQDCYDEHYPNENNNDDEL